MAVGAAPARISLAGASLAGGLEYEPNTDSQRARLALESVETEDFSSGFGPFTEVDSGANVAAGGGTLTVKGSGAWNVNGVYLTTVTNFSKPGAFEIKVTAKEFTGSNLMFGFADGAALAYQGTSLFKYFPVAAADNRIWHNGNATDFAASNALTVDVQSTLRFEWTTGKKFTIKLDGVEIFSSDGQEFGSAIRFQINCHAAFTTPWEFNDFERFHGYPTDDPVATLADIDSGEDGSVWDMSTIAFAGSTTGLTFSYAFGNSASPSNWSAYKTLAQLQAESDPSGRYFKLRVKVSSDGVTQREITEGSISVAVGAGSAASRPAVTAADDEDGTNFTLTIDGDDGETHQVWYRAWGAGNWSDGGTRVGDGTQQVAPGGTGLCEYLVATQNSNDVGYGPAERGWVWVTDGDTSSEIQDALVATLDASGVLTTALGGSGRIYEETPAQGRVLPCVNYRLDGAVNPALGAATRELRLEMDIRAATRAKTRQVEEILDGILNDHSYDTTHWSVRLLPRSEGTSRAMNRSEDGAPLYCRRLAWRVYVRPIES